MYDDCLYDEEGKICDILWYDNKNKDGVFDYLTSLLSKNDWKRISDYRKKEQKEW